MDTRTINEVKENLLKCIEKLDNYNKNGFADEKVISDKNNLKDNLIIYDKIKFFMNKGGDKIKQIPFPKSINFPIYPFGKFILKTNSNLNDFVWIYGDFDNETQSYIMIKYWSEYYKYICKNDVLKEILKEYELKFGNEDIVVKKLDKNIFNEKNEDQAFYFFNFYYVVEDEVEYWERLYDVALNNNRQFLVYNYLKYDDECVDGMWKHKTAPTYYEIYDLNDKYKLDIFKINVSSNYKNVSFYHGWVHRDDYNIFIDYCNKNINEFSNIKMNSFFRYDYYKYVKELENPKEENFINRFFNIFKGKQ